MLFSPRRAVSDSLLDIDRSRRVIRTDDPVSVLAALTAAPLVRSITRGKIADERHIVESLRRTVLAVSMYLGNIHAYAFDGA
jgi:hypothetical protein